VLAVVVRMVLMVMPAAVVKGVAGVAVMVVAMMMVGSAPREGETLDVVCRQPWRVW
jgi:hypothetical protein